ncbi:MAG: undecaprenyldiphospho-muramoylpentapeptide beta-N-acetylglucosaminyltransferase [Firmicutes bacterium HGW-Firmicutes-1]|jgi:UDP-N-acetylglucosamine--N-acetylmuramyl-(pentapeptide) pyrophosphoryl-undecaprenol N-acetylglucosamine transferase|nr:MAG: undecaprenyldiphospho-muramoylpentapeptide beta-N-acetylglucosaminyltransferase [Firmicutes bacterium HGW-Firmicutes-1]
MKKIVLTGGGTAGHVTPNIALIDALRSEGYELYYIGSHDGIERSLIKDTGIPYYGISSGKLRRYLDLKNLSDPFKVMKGCYQAFKLIKKIKPDIIFSKGGFVSVPVIIGGKLNGVPVVLHESDMTPGLANKICLPFASKVCTTFSETLKHLPKEKAVFTGSPIRESLITGDRSLGLKACGFNEDKPVLMMIGGSIGAKRLNDTLRSILPDLLKRYQFVHLCGKGNIDTLLEGLAGYKQFEYVKDELPHLFAMTDIVVSRAGSNAICELLALKKPNVLIPLPESASRGDQLLNAASFKEHGYSYVLQEETMTGETLLQAIDEVYNNKNQYLDHMQHSKSKNGVKNVVREIVSLEMRSSGK